MSTFDPKITLQGIIDELAIKLSSYKSQRKPNSRRIQAMQQLLDDLYIVLENMDALLLFSIWAIAETRMEEARVENPNVGVYIIELRRTQDSDERAIINLNNNPNEK